MASYKSLAATTAGVLYCSRERAGDEKSSRLSSFISRVFNFIYVHPPFLLSAVFVPDSFAF
ncbi:hypothetical protein J2128_001590 [Methanomicrobium sp. W14]|uniref:hypothetical protein n=1 Tax=Methanomicrobium sp. W14 TaxID=2817839 RepID=UPI0032AFC713|nr:hypothetical protein [Methanomicrobium sp. W14]